MMRVIGSPITVQKGHWSLVIGKFFVVVILLLQGCTPKEEIVLRQIKDVVVDASSEPKLKADAIFYNPNKVKMKLKKIKIEIFVNGKKSGVVDQDLKTQIPAQGEFIVPLEVKLALKEMGLLDTIFGMIGGKKFDVHYKGYLKLNYQGIPIRIPVDYKDEVRIRI